jgi:hypothetical protein
MPQAGIQRNLCFADLKYAGITAIELRNQKPNCFPRIV